MDSRQTARGPAARVGDHLVRPLVTPLVTPLAAAVVTAALAIALIAAPDASMRASTVPSATASASTGSASIGSASTTPVSTMPIASTPVATRPAAIRPTAATARPYSPDPEPLGTLWNARGIADAAIASEEEVRITCGVSCHRFPPPEILPRKAWRTEIELMARLREEMPRPASASPRQNTASDRSSRLPDDMRRALAFYERHAPAQLPAPAPWPPLEDPFSGSTREKGGSSRESKLRFRRHLYAPEGGPTTPAVSNVLFADLDGDARLEALGTDMRYGLVFLLRPYAPNEPMRLVSQASSPSHIVVCDLDNDGTKDLLVADLGEFQPGDHRHGAALWLRGVRGAGLQFLPTIIPNLPRVADVEAADLDEDGLADLIVAAFGWRREGALLWLRRESKPRESQTAPLTFTTRTLDPRAGAIHVVPADLDKDGHVDLVAVISQQHEEVVALINDGHGRMTEKSLYAAPHPNWGSSGIQVVDLDKDGDLDVLLTHGDMFDDFFIKPYHGIQWLENRGTFPFTAHTLATLPGVHRALAVDLDRDGDLDIIAATLMPEEVKGTEKLPSIVWLEQTARGVFEPHTLERSSHRHATLDAADYDHDGDVDLLIGNMTGRTAAPAWVEVWENLASTSVATSAPAARPAIQK